MARDKARREALADFLRTRRSQASPASVGLPMGLGYRRTPGLRREEVALLAGISVTWYTWLEQGRDIGVSEQVLESVATTLGLSKGERAYLFRLAHKRVPPAPAPTEPTVSLAVQNALASLGTSPTWILDRCWNTVAWNRASSEVFGDLSVLPQKERNPLRLAFTNETLRRRLLDWETFARRILGAFRFKVGDCVGEPWFTRLVEDLKESSPEFREWWPDHDVLEPPIGRVALNHPSAGLLELDNVCFNMEGDPSLRMCVYAPTPQTAKKIHRLTDSAATAHHAVT